MGTKRVPAAACCYGLHIVTSTLARSLQSFAFHNQLCNDRDTLLLLHNRIVHVQDRLIDGSIEVQRHEVNGPQLLYRY